MGTHKCKKPVWVLFIDNKFFSSETTWGPHRFRSEQRAFEMAEILTKRHPFSVIQVFRLDYEVEHAERLVKQSTVKYTGVI